jgi:hypothetical protein
MRQAVAALVCAAGYPSDAVEDRRGRTEGWQRELAAPPGLPDVDQPADQRDEDAAASELARGADRKALGHWDGIDPLTPLTPAT